MSRERGGGRGEQGATVLAIALPRLRLADWEEYEPTLPRTATTRRLWEGEELATTRPIAITPNRSAVLRYAPPLLLALAIVLGLCATLVR